MTQAFHFDIAQPKGGRVMRRVSQQEWENEHMHKPMTEGEALAVDAACAAFARLDGIADWSDPSWQATHQIEAGRLRTRIRAALTAHTAASGGEVVAWRKRATSVSTGEFFGETPWYDGLPNAADLAQVENANSRGVAHCWIEYAYRTPPAAVPADALTNLVERWLLHNDPHHGKCADELAALIPKGADHEQR